MALLYTFVMNTTELESSKPDLKRLLELQELLITFSAIERMVYIPPKAEVSESNVEHSFSLAMISWFLAPHFPHLDANKLIRLCLAHDMVEVYCGDTFSFDDQAVKGQEEREAVAIETLKRTWADFPALTQAIDEYEEGSTNEAIFVRALDRLHPILMDYLSEGRSWHKLGITFDRFIEVKDQKVPTSPEIAKYYYELRELLVKQPQLFATPKDEA